MKHLVMCSTKQRPHRVLEMLMSFDRTKSEGTDLVIYVSETDKFIDYYKLVLKDRNVIYGPDLGNLVAVLNFLISKFPDYEYYSEVNDDHVYHTKGWDLKLIEAIEEKGGWGVACGRDGVDPDWFKLKHPSAVMISGNIVKILGYFTYPKFEHTCSDDYHRDIGEMTNLIYLEEVFTEHRCSNTVHKAIEDDVYKAVYDGLPHGENVYRDWVANEKNGTRAKLQEAMNG